MFLSLATLSSCQAYSTPRSHIVAINSANFKNIELHTDTQNVCSPDISRHSDFIGIAINAPTEVDFNKAQPAQDGSFTVIPICGFYQLSLIELSKDPIIRLFAINVETEQVYQGQLIEEDPNSDEPLPFFVTEPKPEEIEGQLLSAYFNPNLARFVSLPATEANYKILVQIGEVKSNTVDVKVNLKD
jgi:hypothetical protein